MRTLGMVILLMLISVPGNAQSVVTGEEEYEQEALESRSEAVQDLSDRQDLLDHLSRHPIPINFANADQLSEIPWLNDLQIRNLMLYRRQYGYIVTPYELQLIEGFDRETIESILPYIDFTKDRNKRRISLHALMNEGDDDFLVRPAGLGKGKDSAYLGSAVKLLVKYKYDWQSRVTAGFILEKDPGEPLLKRPLNKFPFTDYGSAYLMITNTGIFKRVIAGDYHLRFGQGLAIWSGYNIGRTIFASGYTRKPPGITPNTSSIETGFMRGMAGTLTFRKFDLTGFLSVAPLDGRLDTLSRITSLVTDGLHRDSLEWRRRHNVTQVAYGGRFAWKQDVSVVGFNFISGNYSKAFASPAALYKKFDFTGSQFFNLSLDHRLVLGKILLTGEVTLNRTGNWAILQNLLIQPRYGFSFFFSVRDYSPAYRAPFGNCLGESGLPQNEKGVFAAVTLLLSNKVTIRSFADFYRYPWLKYRIDAPSSGYEQQLQVEWKATPMTLLILRIGNKSRPLNLPVDSTILNRVENQHRLNIRLNGKQQLGKQFFLQTRAEFNQLDKTSGTTNGYLFLQDVTWKEKKERVGITARIAWYTASYDNRFYTYENDHLFSFSTPMLYGEGTRMYLFGRVRLLKNQTITFKMGYTQSERKPTDSLSTSDTSASNATTSNLFHQVELSIQFIFKI